ncbi:ubiquitin carboxyl-terminal hydrolase 28 isoform X2 [Elgaria multicarinata webbii]|uniref:ubiquitin carboxyl-terminal hydrolase 28 isoform X2 n=1 Tax=Elgaria multicarinata webbii TaxID=159646 RepID=UPI002FCD45C7
MTAELQQQAPEGGASAAESRGRNCSVLINQLREVTGIQDPEFLDAALKAADGNLYQAVSFLTEGRAEDLDQEAIAAEPSNYEGSEVGEEQATSPIDATQDHNTDMQKVISSGDQDFPRIQVLEKDPNTPVNVGYESSLSENKICSKRKRYEALGDATAQNDWRRAGDWPVGLKNVGNTCWFSAVIQSFFQLPEFRRLVFSYSLPHSVLESFCSQSEKRKITFMLELRGLFALMLGTFRKFVDPTAALELIRDAFRTPEEQQQDVSEFTHKLLDWLEDAFKLALNVNGNSQDRSENPVIQLFYGTFQTEGVHEGEPFSKTETFGQYPLQVNGYKNLYECLEGAMVEKETESSPSNQSVKYGQERWFTKLPPVLTFELSRFEFNQSLRQPEKIHNKLEFPQIIYMDRFMYVNKELIQAKRKENKRLKDQIAILQQKLERYMRYGSDAGRFPLPDMLQSVLEFANTRPSTVACPTGPQAKRQTSEVSLIQSRVAMQTESVEDVAGAEVAAHQELVKEPLQPSRLPVEMPEYPAPHVITEDEMNLVTTCLQRWREEVEQDIRDLKNSIELLSQSSEQMYSEPQLHQVPYHLHAVLIHEGQANAGHYWAYVYSQARKSWLKYNDISVTESSWDEVEKDSFGGLKNISAYCLMYINEKLPHVTADFDEEQTQREVDALPPELRHYIECNNLKLEQEVAEWEEQSSKMAQIDQSSSSVDSQYLSSDSMPEQSSPCKLEISSLSTEHARISQDQTAQAIAKTNDTYEKAGGPKALDKSKEAEPVNALPEEGSLAAQAEEQQDVKGMETPAPPSSQISEVEIPSVGKILVRSDADGYNEEVMLSPAMQGVILAIAKARQTFDRDGSEAGLVKAFHEEYSRLYSLSTEIQTPQNDPRLQHVLVYFLRNSAPKQVVERTLLEQFADKNLSFDERSISIMKVARAKLREIGPDEVDMVEYKKWHEDYSLFRKVSVYLLTGLELYQNEQYYEALTYLIYAYERNKPLWMKGFNRAADASLIALYRRKCLLKLNEAAATLIESKFNADEGMSILNELIIPCVQLIISDAVSKDDLHAIEVMRNRWFAYVEKVMNADVKQKLTELLPRLLDDSSEGIVLKEPPGIRPNSPYDLCNRFAAVMESIHGASTVTVK